MQVSVFYLPSVDSRGEIEQGMAGLRGDLYQQMLDYEEFIADDFTRRLVASPRGPDVVVLPNRNGEKLMWWRELFSTKA